MDSEENYGKRKDQTHAVFRDKKIHGKTGFRHDSELCFSAAKIKSEADFVLLMINDEFIRTGKQVIKDMKEVTELKTG